MFLLHPHLFFPFVAGINDFYSKSSKAISWKVHYHMVGIRSATTGKKVTLIQWSCSGSWQEPSIGVNTPLFRKDAENQTFVCSRFGTLDWSPMGISI
jgi:hypothetical protein